MSTPAHEAVTSRTDDGIHAQHVCEHRDVCEHRISRHTNLEIRPVAESIRATKTGETHGATKTGETHETSHRHQDQDEDVDFWSIPRTMKGNTKPKIKRIEEIIAGLVYAVASCLMLLCNKAVSGVFSSMWTLVLFQSLFATTLHAFAILFGSIKSVELSMRMLRTTGLFFLPPSPTILLPFFHSLLNAQHAC